MNELLYFLRLYTSSFTLELHVLTVIISFKERDIHWFTRFCCWIFFFMRLEWKQVAGKSLKVHYHTTCYYIKLNLVVGLFLDRLEELFLILCILTGSSLSPPSVQQETLQGSSKGHQQLIAVGHSNSRTGWLLLTESMPVLSQQYYSPHPVIVLPGLPCLQPGTAALVPQQPKSAPEREVIFNSMKSSIFFNN